MSTSTDKIAIVTGGSQGLGLATTHALAAAGWTTIVDAREGVALERATDTIDDVIPIPGDVSDPIHRQRLIHAAIRCGGLDLLINNASSLGPSPRPRLENYPLDELRLVFEVNVLSPLALIQASLPLLRQRRGVVINVTSDAGTEPYEGWGGYGSSKAALDHMTDILAVEEPDVSMYRFDPGDMNTRMHQEAFPGEDISDRPSPELSVSPLLALVDERPASGAYRASEALAAT